jgi:hypothetical protein
MTGVSIGIRGNNFLTGSKVLLYSLIVPTDAGTLPSVGRKVTLVRYDKEIFE